MLVLLAVGAYPIPVALTAFALLAVLNDLAVWYRYLATPPRSGTFRRAVALLRERRYWVGIVLIGHWLPAGLLVLAWALPPATASAPALLAGVLMVAGALIAKAALILKAAYLVDLFDRFGPTDVAANAASQAA